MRSLSNDRHSHKTQTTPAPAASLRVYMTLLIAPKKSRRKKKCNLYFLARMKFHKVLLRKMTLLTPPLYILNRAWKANAVACSTYTRHYVYTCVSLTHAQSRRSTPSAPELRYTTRAFMYAMTEYAVMTHAIKERCLSIFQF